jgi:hypothetical protein
LFRSGKKLAEVKAFRRIKMAINPRPAILDAWEEVQHDPLTIPPDNFSGMSLDDAVEIITAWFYENFENPVHRTPYESAEGGYQYIWGGPYETRDIIENVFADSASPEIIDAAISELENDSDVWVPSSHRQQPPDDDELPEAPNVAEAYAEMQKRVSALEEALAHTPKGSPGIGHNKPPEPLTPEPLNESDKNDLKEVLATLKAQPEQPTDQGKAAETAFVKFEILRNKLGAWLAQQGLVFTTEAVKEAGKQFGKWAPAAFWLWIMDNMFHVSQAVQTWLHIVLPSVF